MQYAMNVRVPAGLRASVEATNLYSRPEMLEGVQLDVHRALWHAQPVSHDEIELDLTPEGARALAAWLESYALTSARDRGDDDVRTAVTNLCHAVHAARASARRAHPAGVRHSAFVA